MVTVRIRSSWSSRSRAASRRAKRRRAQTRDAIALLKADHRQVEGWFKAFERTSSSERKQGLANRICAALRAHMTIEEEIFYPAFLQATDETSIHHEAEIEHSGAKKLIAEIEASGPDDNGYFDARIKVLSEM